MSCSLDLVEELPESFTQLRNMVLSAYPKNILLPSPYNENASTTAQLQAQFNQCPPLSSESEQIIIETGLQNLLI